MVTQHVFNINAQKNMDFFNKGKNITRIRVLIFKAV